MGRAGIGFFQQGLSGSLAQSVMLPGPDTGRQEFVAAGIAMEFQFGPTPGSTDFDLT
jgi:hypothetical protein